MRSKTGRDVPPGSQAKAKEKSGSPAVMAGAASAGVRRCAKNQSAGAASGSCLFKQQCLGLEEDHLPRRRLFPQPTAHSGFRRPSPASPPSQPSLHTHHPGQSATSKQAKQASSTTKHKHQLPPPAGSSIQRSTAPACATPDEFR